MNWVPAVLHSVRWKDLHKKAILSRWIIGMR